MWENQMTVNWAILTGTLPPPTADASAHDDQPINSNIRDPNDAIVFCNAERISTNVPPTKVVSDAPERSSTQFQATVFKPMERWSGDVRESVPTRVKVTAAVGGRLEETQEEPGS